MQFNWNKARTDKDRATFMKDKSTSHKILTEHEQLIVLPVRIELLTEMNNCMVYTVIAVEARDTEKRDQISISIRICDEDYNVHEHLIGIREGSEGVTTKAIVTMIQDTLQRCASDPKNMITTSFDGTSIKTKVLK